MKVRLHSAGAASRLTALLLPQIFPIFSVVTPCQRGASPPSVRRRSFTTGRSASGCDESQLREVAAVAPRIAREQRISLNRGVGADIEIGKRVDLRAAPPPVEQKGLAGEKGRFPRQRLPSEVVAGDGFVEILNPAETDRHFGVDDRVDHESSAVGTLLQRRGGPLLPL